MIKISQKIDMLDTQDLTDWLINTVPQTIMDKIFLHLLNNSGVWGYFFHHGAKFFKTHTADSVEEKKGDISTNSSANWAHLLHSQMDLEVDT